MKRVVFLIVSILAAFSAFTFAKQFINNDQAKILIAKGPPPEVMCYDMVMIEPKEMTIVDLKEQLRDLEKLYADKKIDESAYKVRKEDLLKKIDENEH